MAHIPSNGAPAINIWSDEHLPPQRRSVSAHSSSSSPIDSDGSEPEMGTNKLLRPMAPHRAHSRRMSPMGRKVAEQNLSFLNEKFDKIKNTVVKTFITQFIKDPIEVVPDLWNASTEKMRAVMQAQVNEVRADFTRAVDRFVEMTAVRNYFISPDGRQAELDGTPTGDLTAAVETAKTLGSFCAVEMARRGKKIFTEAGEHNRKQLLEMIETANKLCGHDEGMNHVFAVHDWFKSKANTNHVAKHLVDTTAIPGLRNQRVVDDYRPLSPTTGKAVSVEEFEAIDHDARLPVALDIVLHEIEAGTHKRHSVTRLMFPKSSKLHTQELSNIASMVRDMWNIGINILQANQAEIGPAQLNQLAKNVIETNEADFERFKAALGALAAHEVTDLMGAANPFLPVLPPSVIEGYFSTYRKLLSGVEEMRARVRASKEKLNPEVEARTLYRTLLPEMPVDENGNDLKSEEVKRVLNDIPDPIFLIKRLAQNLRMKPLTAPDVDILLASLNQVRMRDKQAYADLANQLGRDNQPLFHYYLPQLAESVLKELKRTPESFVLALQTMGRVIGYTNKVTQEQGGPEAFIAKHFASSYDLRKVCIGVISEITTASANLKDFDPAALQFTGLQKIDIVGSEKSVTTTLTKMFGPKDGPSYEQIDAALKNLPSNVSLFLGKETLRSLKGDERAVVLDEIGTLVKSINNAYKQRDGVADWTSQTLEKSLLVVTQLYLLGRAKLRDGQTGPYHIDLHTIIDSLKDPQALLILDHTIKVSNHVALPVANMAVSSNPLGLMNSLAEIPGTHPLIVTSGGSGSILAASVGHLLEQAGKSLAGLISVRYDKIGSVGKNDTRLANRTAPTNSLSVGNDDSNVYQVFPTSTSNGRFVESRASQDFKTFLVVDNNAANVADQIRAAMNALPEKPDSIIYLSMGGSITYSEATEKNRQVFSPSDQHVMSALDTLSQDANPVSISLLSMMNGLDAPKDMNLILDKGNWKYLPFNEDMTRQLLEFDNSLNIADDDEAEYGTTRSSLRLALDGKFGIQALPLPSRVVLDDASVWNFVKFIDPSMRGMTFTNYSSHRNGLESYEKGISSSSEAPIEQL